MENLKKYLYITTTIFIISLIFLSVIISANQVYSKKYIGLNNIRTIEIYGEKEIYVTPDEAEIIFSVLVEDEDYKAALNKNNELIGKVTEYLKENGIEEKDLKTQNFSVYPKYNYEIIDSFGRQRTEIIGYSIENSLLVKVRNLDSIDTLIDGGIRSGANKVNGITFLVSNEQEIRKELRLEAIEMAKKEAELIANSLKVKVGRIINFSESRHYPVRVAYDSMEMSKTAEMLPNDGGLTPISPGENLIKSSIYITVEIY